MAVLLLLSGVSKAQELDVRAYAHVPVDVNLFLLGYGHSTGNILVDPSLPVEGLEANVHLILAKYTRTFDFFGASAGVQAAIPFSFGRWQGVQAGFGRRERDVDGFADARFAFKVNFVGAPALRPREFRPLRDRTVVGATFEVLAPTGQYDPTKLINLGANRWGFRTELGFSRAIGRWHLEAAGTVWLFTRNDGFFGGSTLSQDPLYALQGHVVYSIRPGFWLSVNFGYADGGTTTVDGVVRNTLQRNTRAGLTLQYPLSRRQGLRVAFSRGVTTRVGGDFDSLSVGYQIMWGGGKPSAPKAP
jgi:hypothetical protein